MSTPLSLEPFGRLSEERPSVALLIASDWVFSRVVHGNWSARVRLPEESAPQAEQLEEGEATPGD